MLKDHNAIIEYIQTGSEEYSLYVKLTESPDPGHMIIGKGEAAAIAFAKERDGILASNNLRDIAVYVSDFHLKHKTTGDILKEALDKKLITEDEGNKIWKNMLQKKRKLGYLSFSEFLQKSNV